MAKELPYFKFEVLAYLTGDICLESFELQGIFNNVCAFYWSKDCDLSLVTVYKKYRGYENLINELIELGVLKTDGEYLSISFLNEQWASKETQKMVNAINGKKGGRPKKELEPNGLIDKTESVNYGLAKKTNIEKNTEEYIIEEKNTEKYFAFEGLSSNEKLIEELMQSDWEQHKSDLINALVAHFEFSAPHHKQNRSAIMQFVNSQILTNDDLEHFKNQFASYWEYKKISGEKAHGFQSYLGTPAMRFENSGWNAENWSDKLMKFKANPQNKTKFERAADSYNNAHNPYKK